MTQAAQIVHKERAVPRFQLGPEKPKARALVAMGHFLLLLQAWPPDETMEQVTLGLSAKGGAGSGTCRIPEQGGTCWEFCEGVASGVGSHDTAV